MADVTNLNKAYEFLLQRARDQQEFTSRELGVATGWSGTTPKTYLSKQLKTVVKKKGRGRYLVKKAFIHLERDDFIIRVSQKEFILPSYKRYIYPNVINYEFLMPLTREGLLRSALDALFYKDTLEQKIKLVGIECFTNDVPRINGESDDDYCSRVAMEVANYFGGYSITHVNGRFRACDLLTQNESVGKRYIVDETTALVRFIIPLKAGKYFQGEQFKRKSLTQQSEGEVEQEIALIRTLFLNIFAEVVVHSVQGEDEIWLLETFSGVQKLYKWEVDS